MAYAEGTSVPVEKSRAEIERLLMRHKCTKFAVESKIATFEDEFLSHVLLPNQQTVAQYVGPMVEQIYETGRMPPSRQIAAGDGVIVEGE